MQEYLGITKEEKPLKYLIADVVSQMRKLKEKAN
jgi:hypothetical protein